MERPDLIHIENLLNKFVICYGGNLVTNLMTVYPEKPNADYYFKNENVVAELKCFQKDSFNTKEDAIKFEEIINKWFKKGNILAEDIPKILNREIPIPECCFPDFKAAVTKTIDRIVYKANKQIGQTKIDLKVPRAKGLLLIANDGNYIYSNAEFFKIIIDLMLRKYSECSINGFVYFTVNQASYSPGSNLDEHIWSPCYDSSNNKKLSKFVNDFGEKFLTDFYNISPGLKPVTYRKINGPEGLEIMKAMKFIPKEIIYKKAATNSQ